MSSIQEQINNLRTLQESYDDLVEEVGTITSLTGDINAGKTAISTAINSKGVVSQSTDTLAQFASEIQQIAQSPITLQGSQLYEKQMCGAATDMITAYQQPNSPLWNLYKIMTDLLNDGRFVSYGGILLAEYFKGYDTIELMNVGAGGAYFTCDGDLYTTDKTGNNAHVWHDKDNGKMNRWVAYLFSSESTNYTIPSTSLCPRSIHIGRKVGTIYCSVEGRIREIVVTDGNELGGTNFTSTQVWSQEVVIRNANNLSGLINGNSNISSLIVGVKKIDTPYNLINNSCPNLVAVEFSDLEEVAIDNGTNGNNLIVFGGASTYYLPSLYMCNFPKLTKYNKNKGDVNFHLFSSSVNTSSFVVADFPKLEELTITSNNHAETSSLMYKASPKKIYFRELEYCAILGTATYYNKIVRESINLQYIYLGYKTNDRTKMVNLVMDNVPNLTDIELKNGYLKNLNISYATALTETNILNHILNRLGDNSGQSVLTLTLGATNLAKLTSAESQARLAELQTQGWTIA